jgi:aminopeptidase 2
MEANKTTQVFTVTQNRYLRSGVLSSENDNVIWTIPLGLNVNPPIKTLEDYVLKSRQATFPIPDQSTYLKLNYGQHGFYRVCYAPEDLVHLGECVKASQLPAIDRIGILNDTFELAASGHISTAHALTLTRCFGNEQDYMVWVELACALNELRSVWFEDSESIVERMRLLTRDLFRPLAHQMGFEFDARDSDLKKLLRVLMIGVAGKSGDEKIVLEAQQRFWKFVQENDEKALHPNIRGAVYAIVLKFGGEKEYNAVERIYRETPIIDQKLAALGALGATENKMLIERALDYALSSEVRLQDVTYIFSAVAANHKGRRLLWQFVQDHWRELHRRYSDSNFLLSRIVGISCDSFSSNEMARHIEQFFKDKITDQIRRSVAQSLEKVYNSARWFQRDRAMVSEWLAQHVEV